MCKCIYLVIFSTSDQIVGPLNRILSNHIRVPFFPDLGVNKVLHHIRDDKRLHHVHIVRVYPAQSARHPKKSAARPSMFLMCS